MFWTVFLACVFVVVVAAIIAIAGAHAIENLNARFHHDLSKDSEPKVGV